MNAQIAKGSAPRFARLLVAAYYRVSADYCEQLESLEPHRSHYDEYIRAHKDRELVNVYCDEGISGTRTDTRPGLQRLMADYLPAPDRHGAYQVNKPFCQKHRRLSCLVRELISLIIPIHSEKENINTLDAKGEVLLTIMASLAQQESQSLSQNVKLGLQYRPSRERYRLTTAAFWATPRMRKAISSLIRNRLKS
ncbi:MAG: recombinase family protein [Succinimonas sp.]|nr:recombinase family protein [Succinimonas sp.]